MRSMWKCAVLLLAAALCCSGCSMMEDLRMFKDTAADGGESGMQSDGVTVEGELQLTGSMEAADSSAIPDVKEEDAAAQSADDGELPPGTREVVLYFASADGSALEAEVRAIPEQTGIAKAALGALIEGPAEGGLSPTLPSSVRVNGMNIKDGLCTVDLSGEFLEELSDDPTAELLALYSIVDTLTQFESVQQVRILVDGESLTELGGVNAEEALAPMEL